MKALSFVAVHESVILKQAKTGGAAKCATSATCSRGWNWQFSGEASEFAEAFHFCASGHGAVLLHHGAHLHVLLNDGVDVLHRGAAAGGDALAALAVDQIVIAAFGIGHGVDYGFNLLKATFVNLGVLGNILQRADFGEHVHELFERAHFADLAKLIAKIFQREFFFAELAFELERGFLVNGLLGAFDERHDVAHTENARDDALGIETFEGVVFFAKADELYGGAGNFGDGKRRAAASVAVKFGENDAGEAEALVEFAGGADRVLTDHGVGDEEKFAWLQLFLEMG